jgi:hypothetical protein
MLNNMNALRRYRCRVRVGVLTNLDLESELHVTGTMTTYMYMSDENYMYL